MSDAATAVQTESRAAPAPAGNSIPAANRITELRVAGHLMTLETGLFCVFSAPGSASPDPATGLPGVRVSEAPGAINHPGAVKISTFREDGWLDGTAALVRVTQGPAQVLVTVYQSPRQSQDAAPRLQVMRLSADIPHEAPPGPAAAAPSPATPDPEAVAHVQRTGDVGGMIGDWIGTRGSGLWIEGFGVSPRGRIAPEDIEYQAVLGRGWLSPWVEGGKYCGSRGMALPLLGLNVRLKGEAAKAYECQYSATFIDGSEAGPVSTGESCEAESLAAMEAFQIEIKPRHVRPPASRKAAPPPPASPPAKAPARPPARRKG